MSKLAYHKNHNASKLPIVGTILLQGLAPSSVPSSAKYLKSPMNGLPVSLNDRVYPMKNH